MPNPRVSTIARTGEMNTRAGTGSSRARKYHVLTAMRVPCSPLDPSHAKNATGMARPVRNGNRKLDGELIRPERWLLARGIVAVQRGEHSVDVPQPGGIGTLRTVIPHDAQRDGIGGMHRLDPDTSHGGREPALLANHLAD